MPPPACHGCGAPGLHYGPCVVYCSGCLKAHRNPVPDPERTAVALRRRAGLERAEAAPDLSNPTPSSSNGHTALTWRRTAWQVIGQLASAGHVFTKVHVHDLVGPAPHRKAYDVIEDLFELAAGQQRLERLPGGEWCGKRPRP